MDIVACTDKNFVMPTGVMMYSAFKYKAQTIWKDTPLIEKRPLSWRIKKWLGWGFRKLRLLPALPPYSKEFMDGLIPID